MIAGAEEEPKTPGQSTISNKTAFGIWDSKLNLAYLEKVRGKYIHRMGFASSGRLWLYPEETAFLLDVDELTLADQNGETLEKETALQFSFLALDFYRIPVSDFVLFSYLAGKRYNIYRYRGRDDTIPFGSFHANKSQEGNPALSFRYEAYEPEANFKKSSRGNPDFVVAVVKAGSHLPAIRDIKACARIATPVPMRIAVVDEGSVLFLDVDTTEPKVLNDKQ